MLSPRIGDAQLRDTLKTRTVNTSRNNLILSPPTLKAPNTFTIETVV